MVSASGAGGSNGGSELVPPAYCLGRAMGLRQMVDEELWPLQLSPDVWYVICPPALA